MIPGVIYTHINVYVIYAHKYQPLRQEPDADRVMLCWLQHFLPLWPAAAPRSLESLMQSNLFDF